MGCDGGGIKAVCCETMGAGVGALLIGLGIRIVGAVGLGIAIIGGGIGVACCCETRDTGGGTCTLLIGLGIAVGGGITATRGAGVDALIGLDCDGGGITACCE